MKYYCLVALALLSLTAGLAPSHAQKLPAAANADPTLSALEKEIYQEINLARTRPQEYASYLEQLRTRFRGNTYVQPGRPELVTQEGPAALDEAVRFLRGARPLTPYAISKGMCLGANLLVKDQGPKGLTGHRGTDGSFCEQRVARFGAFQGGIGENLSYGTDTARERVMTLIIDDGFTTRGHRQRLFSPEYKVVGVSCGDHTQLGTMCVITFAGGFSDGAANNTARPTKAPTKPAPAQQQPARKSTTRF